jgi:CHAT domain-containing protein
MLLEKLTITDLDTVNHDLAQIAYLSACSTAEVKVSNLIDESIHLASTFQLVGFPHVVGTLRGARNSAAVEVAKKFYEGLHRSTEGGSSSVAQALHDAVLCLRNSQNNWKDISSWAPFIHIGC